MDDAAASYLSLRRYLRRRGIRAVIPSKSDRYEKREVNYVAMVTIAAIVLLWLE
jgi:hypothetical protein